MDIHDRPGTDERLREFAQGLRDLRRRAGSPSYRTLAADAGYSSSTLSAAASGDRLPTLTVTLAYVTACRGDVGAWADRWRALSTRLALARGPWRHLDRGWLRQPVSVLRPHLRSGGVHPSRELLPMAVRLPSPVARRCGFEVYVPDSANASARVWYDVMDRFEDAQYQVGQFAVDQAANRGRWVSAATIVINTAEVMIMIGGDGRGLPPDRNAVAASPLRLTCSQM